MRSIKEKMWYLFGGAAILMVLLGGYAFKSLLATRHTSDQLLKVEMERWRVTNAIRTEVLASQVIDNRYLERADENDLAEYRRLAADIREDFQRMAALSAADSEGLTGARRMFDKLLDLFDKKSLIFTGKAASGDPQAMHKLLADSDDVQKELNQILATAAAKEETELKAMVQEISVSFQGTTVALVVLFLSVLAAFIAIYLAAQRMVASITGMTSVASQIASQGALTLRVEKRSDDEIGELAASFNKMTDSLLAMVTQMRQATNDLAASGAQILSATSEQSASISQQAASVSEATTTIEEIRQTAEQAAERAQEMIGIADRSEQVSQTGAVAVDQSIRGINEVRGRVGSIAKNILLLSQRTQQISDIIATVNELAERSNLLAVNASIEAAKAGEYGKGFAVVASEVHALADQSKAATKDVRTMLSEIQKATNDAVMVTEEGTKQAESAVRQAEQAGGNIKELAEVIQTSAQSARQIATSARQQASGIEQIVIAFKHINQATSESAVGARQTESSAADIKRLSDKLRDLIAPYRL